MAAIIAHLTRRNRERKKHVRARRSYSSAKCVHQIPPFDPHFEPQIHNKYIARRNKGKTFKIDADLRLELQQASRSKFSLKRCFMEVVIIGNLLVS